MRKIALVLAVLGAFAVPALAADWPFEASVIQTGDLGALTVYQRYFSSARPEINANCVNACGLAGVNCETFEGQPICKLTYVAKNTGGYRGYTENLFNFSDAPDGTVFQSVFEYERNGGAGNHQGYFAWVAGPAVVGANSTWNATTTDCVGTGGSSCIGVSGSAQGRDQSNVPSTSGGPTLAKIGGLSPIPIPKAVAGAPAGVFRLQWDPVTSVGKSSPLTIAGYDIYVSKAANCGSAALPASFTLVKTVTGTTADVTEAEAGLTPGQQAGVTFALKLRYGSTSTGIPVVSRFLSANGQCFLNGGLSANVYELVAKYAGKNNVEVTWKTSLEDGVRGFYVSRSTTQNGPYSRVSDLIPAKGEASAYSFIDTIQMPAGPTKASGLWYKVETIDIDDNAVEFGPAKAQLPNQGSNIIKQRTAKPQR